jgi:hypothetical protein
VMFVASGFRSVGFNPRERDADRRVG